MSDPTRWGSLEEELAGLDREPLAGASGVRVATRRAAAVDRALRTRFPAERGLALVAVGGYGRSELAPGSDIDLLVIHGPGGHARAEDAFGSVLYGLWDLGLTVGHAVRTPEECRTEAERRFESVTALLDARLLAGDPTLLRDALIGVRAAVTADPGRLLDDLRASMVQREARFGALGETLQPDLRDSVGGLRDVHLFGWLARGISDDPVARGWVRPTDADAVGAAWDFFLLARTALHRLVGRRSDALVAEQHQAMAESLGIEGEAAEPPAVWDPRDVFMRRVFLHGRTVRAAAETALIRAAADVEPQAARAVAVHWSEEPVETAMDAFARLAAEGGSLSSDDLDRIERIEWSGPAWPPSVRRAFTSILAAGEGGARSIGIMDRAGVLRQLLPEWDAVRGRPQRDPFHRYPADTHLIQSAARLARLLFRPEDPLAAASVAMIADPGPLLIAALLHDIGKVGAGSHVPEGTRIAATVLDRLGLDDRDRDFVLFLVGEHLMLSDSATRRNLEDPDFILHVAARVGSPDRLAGLYLLSLADAEATGPGATTPWRMGLIRELVVKVTRAFERGEMNPDRAAQLARAEARVRSSLADEPPEAVDDFLARVPPAYLLWADPADAPTHVSLITPRPGRVDARTHHRPGRTEGVHLLTVGAADRPGLLADIAGALTLAGLSVLSAQAFTTDDGVVLDAFDVTGAFEPEITEDRWRRFRSTLRHALEGRVDVADRILRLRQHYRPAATGVEVKVRIDQTASDYFTVVEVGAADRMGLLFDLARTFADGGVDVHSAKVATYGPRVVDVFYVTTRDGQKLDESSTEALSSALGSAAG